MRGLLLSLTLLCLTACASTKTPPVPTRVEPASTPRPASAPAKTPPDVDPSPCVQTCLDGRRTEAIAWDVIESECRRQCETPAPTAP